MRTNAPKFCLERRFTRRRTLLLLFGYLFALHLSPIAVGQDLADAVPTPQQREDFQQVHHGIYLPPIFMQPGTMPFEQRKEAVEKFKAISLDKDELDALRDYWQDSNRNFWLRTESAALQVASGKLSEDALIADIKSRTDSDPAEWIIYLTAIMVDCKINQRVPDSGDISGIKSLLDHGNLNVRATAMRAALSLGLAMTDDEIAKYYQGNPIEVAIYPKGLPQIVQDVTNNLGSIDDAALQLIGHDDKYTRLWSLDYLTIWGRSDMRESVEETKAKLQEARQHTDFDEARFDLCIKALGYEDIATGTDPENE